MLNNYQKYIPKLFLFFAFIFSACAQTPQVKKSVATVGNSQKKTLWWEDKPNFSLPFTVVYGGAKVQSKKVLQKGFSHIAFGSDLQTFRTEIPAQKRAFLWTGIAYHDRNSPWAKDKSPWGNDLSSLTAKWMRKLEKAAIAYGEEDGLLHADLVVLDVEADLKGKKILQLKAKESTPAITRNVSDVRFIEEYDKAMSKLYCAPLDALKKHKKGLNKISSYGDTPIVRTWHGIDDFSWKEWQTKVELTDHLGKESQFSNRLNHIAPSAYFFYNRGENLAYCLFQLEANAAWSDKPQILFLTPRYVGKGNYGTPLPTDLAEAIAIFPFFSGAEGIWFWEKSKDRKSLPLELEPVYRSFHTGLYRLSEYSDFFSGNFIRVIPDSAHALFTEKKIIWRGIEKDNKLLVAAQNPYAKTNENTSVSIQYKNLETELKLTGRQITFQVFEL